jgi:hypothetical protein
MPAGLLRHSDFKIGIKAPTLARLIAAVSHSKTWVAFVGQGSRKLQRCSFVPAGATDETVGPTSGRVPLGLI